MSGKRIYHELRGSMKTPRRVFVISLGGVCVAVGVITLPIPLVPSRTVMLPGVLILSIYSPTAYRWLKQRTQKYPRVQSRVDRVRNWIINRIHPSR